MCLLSAGGSSGAFLVPSFSRFHPAAATISPPATLSTGTEMP